MNKKTSIIIVIMMLISISLAVVPTVNALPPFHAVKGVLYIGETPAEPGIEIKIAFDDEEFTGDTFELEYDPLDDRWFNYNVGVWGHEEETGNIFVFYSDQYVIPTDNDTVYIHVGEPDFIYMDLHIDEIVNNPPNEPSNPSPADGAINVDNNKVLSWSCSDPDGDPLTYDVYFGDSTSPPLVSPGQTGTTYDPPGAMDYSGIYYWQITAKDDKGASTDGPEWGFTVEATEPPPPPPPGPPSNPPSNPPLPPPKEEEPILNNPPVNLTVDGDTTGDANTNYTFTANATDPDENDTICYTFNWSDGSNDTVTGYFASGIAAEAIHQWTAAGIYTIQVYAMDSFNATSGTESFTILIDVIYVQDIGYIIDNDGDDVYEDFYSNETENTTATEYDEENESYLINSDGAEGWEWVYEPPTDTLTEYSEAEPASGDEEPEDNTIWYMLGLGIILAILLLVGIYYFTKKKPVEKKPQKKSTKKK